MFEEGKAIGLVRGFVSDGYYTVNDFYYQNGQYILKDGVPDISNALRLLINILLIYLKDKQLFLELLNFMIRMEMELWI